MLQYSKEPYYLILRTERSFPVRHYVEILPYDINSLNIWDKHFRLSPIVRLIPDGMDKKFEPFPHETEYWIFLINQRNPIEIETQNFKDTYLFASFGSYSLIAITKCKKEIKHIQGWLKKTNIPAEQWHIKDTVLCVSWFQLAPTNPATSEVITRLATLKPTSFDSVLNESLYEFSCILLDILTKIEVLPKTVQKEILYTIDSILKKVLEFDSKKDHSGNMTYLLQANDALSRFSSQALSGISPILENGSHFGNHSLLGIGCASRGLRSIFRFYENVVGSTFVPQRIDELVKYKIPDGLNLEDSRYLSKFIESKWIEKVDFPKKSLDQITSLIPYFSALDGYKSKDRSLSVPTSSLEACCNTKWSLATITHEISHVIVKAVLSIIFGDIEDKTNLDRLYDYFDTSPSFSPANMLEVARKLVLDGLHKIYLHKQNLSSDGTYNYGNANEISKAIQDCFHEINETITHIFDFYNFYDSNIEKYVSGIWRTWAVHSIKNDRTEDYLVRTITAVSIFYITTKGNPHKDALGMVKTFLKYLSDANRGDNNEKRFVDGALAKLEDIDSCDRIATQCHDRIPLVSFARAFLALDDLANKIQKDETPTSGGNYPIESLNYNGLPISNPHMFIQRFTSENKATLSRSLWLYHELAFAVDQNGL